MGSIARANRGNDTTFAIHDSCANIECLNGILNTDDEEPLNKRTKLTLNGRDRRANHMATSANKRRRLASDTLSQPFKSPFKTPSKQVDDADNSAATRKLPTTPAPKIHRTTSGATPLLQSDPDVSALQKRHTKLLNQLSTLRSELDTYTQALKIETSNKDAELEELVVKWKAASHAAAEEVFAGARDRVNRMGGLRGLRERERTRNQSLTGWGWDQEDKTGTNREREELEGEERYLNDESRSRENTKVDDDDNDDNGYTMDMMLKAMNIDLAVIGYDKDLQRWIE